MYNDCGYGDHCIRGEGAPYQSPALGVATCIHVASNHSLRSVPSHNGCHPHCLLASGSLATVPASCCLAWMWVLLPGRYRNCVVALRLSLLAGAIFPSVHKNVYVYAGIELHALALRLVPNSTCRAYTCSLCHCWLCRLFFCHRVHSLRHNCMCDLTDRQPDDFAERPIRSISSLQFVSSIST